MLFTFYLISTLLIKASYSYTTFTTCHCNICEISKTVGIEYLRRCYFIEVDRFSELFNRPTMNPQSFGPLSADIQLKQIQSDSKMSSIMHVPDQRHEPRSYADFLKILHTLTRHFFKVFNQNEVIIALDHVKRLKNSIRIPSYDNDGPKCQVYDIRSNLIYYRKKHCDSVEKIFISADFTPKSANIFTHDTYFPQDDYRSNDENYYPCFTYQQKTSCVYMQYQTYECSQLFQVIDQKTYEIMEKYSLYKTGSYYYSGTNKAFLVYYDSSRYKLKQSDYYMEVLTYKTRRSKDNCYIADVQAGKLFQQTSCEKAVENLRANYFDNAKEYTSMCTDQQKLQS